MLALVFRVLVAALVLCCNIAFGQAQSFDPNKPTFDCTKARSALALVICSGEEAARADWDLRIASWTRFFSLKESDRAVFWQEQDKWLQSVSQKCRILHHPPPFSGREISCVVNAYRGGAAIYRSKLTGDALAESKLKPEQLADIQSRLIASGFLEGDVDGEFGPVTREAIKKFQLAKGFQQGDYLSLEQRQALIRSGESGEAQSDAVPSESGQQ
jgi:hypothetical protein